MCSTTTKIEHTQCAPAMINEQIADYYICIGTECKAMNEGVNDTVNNWSRT